MRLMGGSTQNDDDPPDSLPACWISLSDLRDPLEGLRADPPPGRQDRAEGPDRLVDAVHRDGVGPK